MRIPSRRRIKKELSRRLTYYPLLRMLLLKPFFRIAFLGASLILLVLGLVLPRIWVTSPAGFFPVVKVSGLDLLQARSLKRAALKAAALGNANDAAYSWQAAVANNAADIELVRGFLSTLEKFDQVEERHVKSGVRYMFWLLRLSGTNRADLELSAKVSHKYHQHSLTRFLLEPHQATLTPAIQAIYLKSLFHEKRIAEFEKLLAQLESQNYDDSDLPLYKAAYAAGWKNGADAHKGLQQLEEALLQAPSKQLAARLLLIVSQNRRDPEQYQSALELLELAQADSILDHTAYWRLLKQTGENSRAQQLALAYSKSPESASEAIHLAKGLILLGLESEATDTLARFSKPFSDSRELWVLYATLLIEEERWSELRSAALQIRRTPAVRTILKGYSYYLEGRAELGQQRPEVARPAFEQAAAAGLPDHQLALHIALALHHLDFHQTVLNVLEPWSEAAIASNDPRHWEVLFKSALAIKNAPTVLTAAEKLFQNNPKDATALNRYAAALIVNRTRPQEAVALTLQLLSNFPNSLAGAINHTLALLLNQRTEEAREILEQINPDQLSPLDRSSYYLAAFEVYYNLRQWERAKELLGKIEDHSLFPTQVTWLEQCRLQLAQHLP